MFVSLMVDTIKIFICTERMGDFTLHLSCFTNMMLHVFATAGHHNYAKGARLYVQMMKTYEKGSVEEIEIISSFKKNGNHAVRYSSNEWSGVWIDLRNFDEEFEVRRWHFGWSFSQW